MLGGQEMVILSLAVPLHTHALLYTLSLGLHIFHSKMQGK